MTPTRGPAARRTAVAVCAAAAAPAIAEAAPELPTLPD
jgi:hypothetical protein